jgi:hypothetical protein
VAHALACSMTGMPCTPACFSSTLPEHPAGQGHEETIPLTATTEEPCTLFPLRQCAHLHTCPSSLTAACLQRGQGACRPVQEENPGSPCVVNHTSMPLFPPDSLFPPVGCGHGPAPPSSTATSRTPVAAHVLPPRAQSAANTFHQRNMLGHQPARPRPVHPCVAHPPGGWPGQPEQMKLCRAVPASQHAAVATSNTIATPVRKAAGKEHAWWRKHLPSQHKSTA